MKYFLILFFIVVSVLISPTVQAASATNDTTFIYLKDYGLERTKKKDCVKYINEAIGAIKGNLPKVLVFNRGTYHFYPGKCQTREYFESNTTDINPKVCAFLFENVNNLVIDGRGSTLIFHGQMQPFTFDNCKNITLKNITIDWETPLIAQAKVLEANDRYLEIGINHHEFPYRVEDGKLIFNTFDGFKNRWKSTMEFDEKGRYIVPETGDRGCLGRGWENYEAINIMPGVLRLQHNFLRLPKVGNYLVLRHAERVHSGVFIQESNNITIKNLNLYHATGLGILAQFSENLTFDEYRAIPNRFKNHYFGGGDDGLQISNCKGQITVENCEFAGLMDDPINVHGTSVQVVEIVSNQELKCKFMHHQSEGLNWGHKGDKISFIENDGMHSLGTGELVEFKAMDTKHFLVRFKTAIPASLEIGDALENLSWSPDFLVKNSQFKNCRARSILVSTPGKVVIEGNTFESSGSAILIAGDANGWFESGAVTDVLIKNNIFTELCNTSPYQFCEGIISIYPIIPIPMKSTSPFHKNIRIEGNQFNPFDFPVLYARSVDGITFSDNTLTRSHSFEPYHKRKFNYTFENCTNVRIMGNQFSDDLLGKNILLQGTPKSELESDVLEIFDIIQK